MLAVSQKTPQFSQIVIDIDDVDLANRTVTGHDKTNVLIQASFRETPGAALRIPIQGEKWTVQRIGYQWRLGQRLDSPDEHAALTDSMVPGDSRISAGGTLHINAQSILYNGSPLAVSTYEKFTADGTSTAYVLTEIPVAMTIQAFINGLLIDPTTITVTTKTLTFAAAPAAGTLIVYYQHNP